MSSNLFEYLQEYRKKVWERGEESVESIQKQFDMTLIKLAASLIPPCSLKIREEAKRENKERMDAIISSNRIKKEQKRKSIDEKRLKKQRKRLARLPKKKKLVKPNIQKFNYFAQALKMTKMSSSEILKRGEGTINWEKLKEFGKEHMYGK